MHKNASGASLLRKGKITLQPVHLFPSLNKPICMTSDVRDSAPISDKCQTQETATEQTDNSNLLQILLMHGRMRSTSSLMQYSYYSFLTRNWVGALDSSSHLIAGTEKGSAYVTGERQKQGTKRNEEMTCLAEVHTPAFAISAMFLSITDLLLQISEGHNSTRDKI